MPQYVSFGLWNKLTIADDIAAAGTTHATATPLSSQVNIVTTCAAGAGVKAAPMVAITAQVLNRSANALLIYPPVGAAFEAYSVNEAVSIAVGTTLHIVMTSATQGYVF